MDQTSSQNLRRRMRWKCRSDGKRGTMRPSHSSHRPWKSPKNGDYHIPTARQLRRYTDISNGRITLSFLMSSNTASQSKAEMSYLRDSRLTARNAVERARSSLLHIHPPARQPYGYRQE